MTRKESKGSVRKLFQADVADYIKLLTDQKGWSTESLATDRARAASKAIATWIDQNSKKLNTENDTEQFSKAIINSAGWDFG